MLKNKIKVKVKEIFSSIQGEGPLIGYEQLFIRFCGCNLNCAYCDTDFRSESTTEEFTADELLSKIEQFNLSAIHSISLTGGEPLLHAEYLREFLPLVTKPVYLETNATLADEYLRIADYIDYVSADIKLPSASGIEDSFKLHEKFFTAVKKCRPKNPTFAKIVFDKNITDFEISQCVDLAKEFDLDIILQPRMIGNDFAVSRDEVELTFEKFITNYPKTRLIPQVHKFLNIR